MRNRILLIAGIGVLIVAATIFALAQGHPGSGERMHGGMPQDMVEHISRELNLTDAQKEQVKAILDSQSAAADERRSV